MKHKVLHSGIIGAVLLVASTLCANLSSAQVASSSSSSTVALSPSAMSTTTQLSSDSISSPSSIDMTTSSSTVVSSSTQLIEASTTPTSNIDANSTSTVIQSSTFDISSSVSTTPSQASTSPSSSLPLVIATSTATPPAATSSTTSSSTATSSSAPENLSAMVASPSQINLAWNRPANVTSVAGYAIYRNGLLLTSIVPTSTANPTYSDYGLTASTTYTYAVASYDATGNVSGQSASVSATTKPGSPLVPMPTGSPTCDQTILNVPGDYQTIQAAVNAASIGDTVKVAAGIYGENISLRSGICLEGAGIGQTVISKTGAPGIVGNGVSYVIVKNLTVENNGCQSGTCGAGGDGGGIALYGSSNITISSCRLTENGAANGGGMFASASTVSLDHSLIDGNTAQNVGAGIVAEANSMVTLTNVTLADNRWQNALGNGGVGGIRSYASTVQLDQSIVWGNNDVNFAASGARVSDSDIEGWSGGTNAISSDPEFTSAGDYHLQSGSPAATMGY